MVIPPGERPTARELRDGSVDRKQIAGRPADVCPYCGCALFVTGTRQPAEMIRRYVACRNSSCGRRFESRQPPAVLAREIGSDN